MALLLSVDLTVILKPVHQNRAPHLFSSTSTHGFPTSSGELRDGTCVLACIH